MAKKKTATKKTSRRPPAMPDLIAVTVSVPSLEDRLDTIEANALTISALADHINRASSAYDSGELSRAIQRAADNVRDELAWLASLQQRLRRHGIAHRHRRHEIRDVVVLDGQFLPLGVDREHLPRELVPARRLLSCAPDGTREHGHRDPYGDVHTAHIERSVRASHF